MNKKRKINITTAGAILLLLGVLVLINLISINLFTRIDLTQGHIYTLAKASKEVVSKLPDRLTVKCYFSKDLPAPYSSNARYLKDQLEEYRAHSNGNFHFEFVDPASEEELEAEAQSYRIQPAQVNVVQADKIELKKVYMGMVFLYQDKHETIPLMQTTAGLEYDITSTIKKLISTEVPKIAFLQGQGEPNPFQDMSALSNALQKNYQVTMADVSNGQMIPDDVDALLIIRPTETFSEWAKFAVDQYIMKGGKVGFLINKVNANLQDARAVPNNLNIDDLTSNYGFRINNDLVYDQRCGMVNIRQQQGFFTIQNAMPYPFFPNIRNFNKTNAITRELEDLSLYFASSIDTSLANRDSAATFKMEKLAWTSEKSNKQAGRYEINPMMGRFGQMNFPLNGIPVAAIVTGKFHSFYAGKEIPKAVDAEGKEVSSTFTGEVINESPETRMLVMGEGNFCTDTYLGSRSNADFFLNLTDWLSQDESLIHIRTREITARPLTDTSESAKRVAKYANIFFPSVIVVLIGVVRWQIRRKQKPEL
jgi:gliding-associated putative ABC transporter substrate-binding component GldG